MLHLLEGSKVELGFFERIALVFSDFNPVRDVIDILLLAAMLFFAFRFLKSRKTVAIVIGVLSCLVVMTLARFFELRALYTIFEAILSGGPILIIVLFQPEIRDILERIGTGSLKGIMTFSDRRKKRELYTNVIDNICAAVKDLSAESTGALIVIERTTRLSDIISTGVTINADVNASLLRNLFYNKAPLHDGAVVVAEGRISAAGCFLPLTRRTDLNSELGTRHRAAIGMSETSDAIIIVVSEETGQISIAEDGRLTRNYTRDSLNEYLTAVLLPEIPETPWNGLFKEREKTPSDQKKTDADSRKAGKEDAS